MKIIISLLLIIFIIYPLIILLSALNLASFSADYLIILGNALNNNKISKVLYFRLNKAIKIINKNPDIKIVLSGGITSKNAISEASAMKQYLISKGIKENNIILEEKSLNTINNIYNTKDIVENKKTIILSSNYHILRIRIISKLFKIKNVKFVSCYTPIFNLIKHIFIEEIFIFVHTYKILHNKY